MINLGFSMQVLVYKNPNDVAKSTYVSMKILRERRKKKTQKIEYKELFGILKLLQLLLTF
jgi:hypothetical protein